MAQPEDNSDFSDARLVEMIAIRKTNAASSEKLKQPVLITNNAPRPASEPADTGSPPQSAKPAMSSEDDAEF